MILVVTVFNTCLHIFQFVAEGTEMCVSWDFAARDWITEGCTTTIGGAGVVTCNCNHLTNFAVLVVKPKIISTYPVRRIIVV